MSNRKVYRVKLSDDERSEFERVAILYREFADS